MRLCLLVARLATVNLGTTIEYRNARPSCTVQGRTLKTLGIRVFLQPFRQLL